MKVRTVVIVVVILTAVLGGATIIAYWNSLPFAQTVGPANVSMSRASEYKVITASLACSSQDGSYVAEDQDFACMVAVDGSPMYPVLLTPTAHFVVKFLASNGTLVKECTTKTFEIEDYTTSSPCLD